MSSYIRIDDKVHMDKINPYYMSTMFTPPGATMGNSYGKVLGGNVTQPLVNIVNPKEDALGGSIYPQAGEISPGSKEINAVGWRKPDLPMGEIYPTRRYDSPPWEMHDRMLRQNGTGRVGLFGIPTNQMTGLASLTLLSFIGLYSLYSRR